MTQENCFKLLKRQRVNENRNTDALHVDII